MNKTKIEWCDYTWNPIVGCSPISVGCENCYAEKIAKRFGMPWGAPVFYPERLDEPQRVKKPSRVFVCSMSDIGHHQVRGEWITQILAACEKAPQHAYIFMTKRPGNLGFYETIHGAKFMDHWLGVTVENSKSLKRWVGLNHVSAKVKFVSVEPMLGFVSFKKFVTKPDWVIAGPETGSSARPCNAEWIEALSQESQCFFDKRKTQWTRREFPAMLRERRDDNG